MYHASILMSACIRGMYSFYHNQEEHARYHAKVDNASPIDYTIQGDSSLLHDCHDPNYVFSSVLCIRNMTKIKTNGC